MLYANTFLSHNSHDKPVVEKFADRLVQHGIIPWLDKHDIPATGDLEIILKTFIEKHSTATVFLSKAALESKWVTYELKIILEALPASHILPIYIGDPFTLVNNHPLLKERWLTETGQVKQKGFVIEIDEHLTDEAFKKAVVEQVNKLFFREQVREQVEEYFYNLIATTHSDTLVINLQQRGVVLRSGEPEVIPEIIKTLPANTPSLVLRPFIQAHRETIDSETFVEHNWQSLKTFWTKAIKNALGDIRKPKKVYMVGQAQLATPFLIGHILDRTSRVDLFCINITPSEQMFTNQGQERRIPLEGGNPDCQQTDALIPAFNKDEKLEKLCLLVSTRRYLSDVVDYLKAHPECPPLAWIETGIFNDSEQVMALVKDIVAFLTKHQVKELYLFTGLPFHVLPILAANLTHVVGKVTFMEYRRNLQGKAPIGEMYSPLEI